MERRTDRQMERRTDKQMKGQKDNELQSIRDHGSIRSASAHHWGGDRFESQANTAL